jgi:hypothetical protein
VHSCQISDLSLRGYHHLIILHYAGRVLSKTNPAEEKLSKLAVVQTHEFSCRTVTKENYFAYTAGPLNFQTHTEEACEKRFLAKGMLTILFNSLATGLDI